METRRHFLKKGTLLGMALTPLPYCLRALPRRSSPTKRDHDLVFLFQGDSITDGNRGRSTDLNHSMGHGYAFSIASRVGAEFPDKNLRFFNRGVSGNKITDLAQRWQTDTLALKPDVLSILIGVNDAASVLNHRDSVSVSRYETVYASLLEQTRQALPDTLFVLGEPFILPNPTFKDKWADWQIDIQERQQVVQRLASTFNAVYVPYQKAFSAAVQRAPVEYWIWDGIHPTIAGHELMTREWLKQVRHRLHFLKRST